MLLKDSFGKHNEELQGFIFKDQAAVPAKKNWGEPQEGVRGASEDDQGLR